MSSEHVTTIVVGGGQAGLAAGHALRRSGTSCIILDAHERVGDAWRQRWDSLRLFTQARFAALPGMRFPAPPRSYPTKDAVADYLEAYARRFGLPVRLGVDVDGVRRTGAGFEVTAGARRFTADTVILATGAYQRPSVPAFAAQLDPRIRQLHSSEYRNPAQLGPGPALVVGAGNSGAEIALELGRGTVLSGPSTGRLPLWVQSRLYWWLIHDALTTATRAGRRLRDDSAGSGAPLIRVTPRALRSAGVERAGRTAGVTDGRPRLEDGRVLDVAAVVWCTGYAPDFARVGIDGELRHERGVVRDLPGLYVLGLPFQHTLSSSLIGGVGRDAAYIARHIAAADVPSPRHPVAA